MARQEVSHNIEFSAHGGQYFRVWSLNLLLIIVTLGLYSPWATVNRLRFMASHTRLLGEPFAFHGSGLPIFQGRLALSLIVGSWLLVSVYPWIAVILAICFFAIPYLLVLRFRYYISNYSYRGTCFSFEAKISDGYKVYGGAILLALLSFLTAFPLCWFLHRRFVLHRTSFAGENFCLEGAYWWRLARCYLPSVALIFCAVLAWVGIVHFIGPDKIEPYRVWPWLLVYALPFYLLFLFVMASINARVGNFFWNHLRYGDWRFEMALETMELFGLYLRNSFFLIVTMGFYWPWVKINILRYRIEKLTLISS